MSIRSIFCVVVVATMIHGVSGAFALTLEEQAVLRNFRNGQHAAAFVHGDDGRQSRLMGPTTPPDGCIAGAVAALTPPAGATTVTVTNVTGNAFQLSYWRAACTDNAARSAVLFRVGNAAGYDLGQVFVCGGNFRVVQNGVTYDTIAVRTDANPNHAQCASTTTDQTFILAQYPHLQQFDSQLEFQAFYRFSLEPVVLATVPAHAGGSSSIGIAEPGLLQLGWWYNAGQAGRGWGIGRNGDKLFLGGFLYATTGEPNWMISNLDRTAFATIEVNGLMVTSAVYKGALIYCRNGQSLEMAGAKAPDCAPQGSVELATSGARAARLTIRRTDTGTTMVNDLVPFEIF